MRIVTTRMAIGGSDILLIGSAQSMTVIPSSPKPLLSAAAAASGV